MTKMTAPRKQKTNKETPIETTSQLPSYSSAHMFQRLKGTGETVDAKKRGELSSQQPRWSRRRNAAGCQSNEEKKRRRRSSALLFPPHPFSLLRERHPQSGNAGKSHEAHPIQPLVSMSPLQWDQHHPEVCRTAGVAVEYCKVPRPPKPGLGTPPSSLVLIQQLAGHTDLPCWHSEHVSTLVPSNRVIQRRLSVVSVVL